MEEIHKQLQRLCVLVTKLSEQLDMVEESVNKLQRKIEQMEVES